MSGQTEPASIPENGDQDDASELLRMVLGSNYEEVVEIARNDLAAHKFAMTQGVSSGGVQFDNAILEALESNYRDLGGDPEAVPPDHVMAHNGYIWADVPVTDAHYDQPLARWVVTTP